MLCSPEFDAHVRIWSDKDPADTAHLAFRNRLRSNTADRDLCSATKRQLVQQDGPTMNHYAEAKTDAILQILGRNHQGLALLPAYIRLVGRW